MVEVASNIEAERAAGALAVTTQHMPGQKIVDMIAEQTVTS